MSESSGDEDHQRTPMTENSGFEATPKPVGLGIAMSPNSSPTHESSSSNHVVVQSSGADNPSTPKFSSVQSQHTVPSAPMYHLHSTSSLAPLATRFPSANLASTRLAAAQQATSVAAYGKPTRPDIFTVFNKFYPDLESRYNAFEVQMLEAMQESDRNIFLLYQLYGETKYTEALLRGKGIMPQYARERYRECCRIMWRWHRADKQAFVQAIHEQEAQKFDTIGQLMVHNFKTNAWPRDVLCTQWLKYQSSPETYLDET